MVGSAVGTVMVASCRPGSMCDHRAFFLDQGPLRVSLVVAAPVKEQIRISMRTTCTAPEKLVRLGERCSVGGRKYRTGAVGNAISTHETAKGWG